MKIETAPLIEAALQARANSYCPYSRFAVGAAVQPSSGKIFSGTNVENILYGLTLCTERAPVAPVVAGGEQQHWIPAIVSDSTEPIAAELAGNSWSSLIGISKS